MIVNANDRIRTVLLFIPEENFMEVLSTSAFSVAQGRKKMLVEQYRNAIILDCDGSVRKIEDLLILGLCGKSFLGKLFSFINGFWWNIEVHLSEPLPFSFEEVKELIIEYINKCNGVFEDDEWSPKKLDINLIRAAQNFDALWSVLDIPEPENALDVL